jgi:enolase
LPQRGKPRSAIQLILQAIEAAGYTAGDQIALGLDCAASEFYKDGIRARRRRRPQAPSWTDMLAIWCDKYPIITIEDGMPKATGTAGRS